MMPGRVTGVAIRGNTGNPGGDGTISYLDYSGG